MVFFPHKTGRNPANLQDFLAYSEQCVKKQDHLAALFYCYWAMEEIKKEIEKPKKKDVDKIREYYGAFLARGGELRKMYNAKPVASTMEGAELEMMRRRIQDLKAEFGKVEATVPTSDEEAGKLAEKLKDLSEEASFLDELFSPMGKVEGAEAWQDRLGKGVEHLFTSLAGAKAEAEAKAAEVSKQEEEAKKKEESKVGETRKKEDAKAAKAAEAKKKEEAKVAEAKLKEDAKAAEAKKKEDAKAAEAKKKEEAKKAKGEKKAEEDKKE